MTTAQQAYSEALRKERAAWEALRGRLPGSADFDLAAWTAWREAVAASDEALNALRSASKPADYIPRVTSARGKSASIQWRR